VRGRGCIVLVVLCLRMFVCRFGKIILDYFKNFFGFHTSA